MIKYYDDDDDDEARRCDVTLQSSLQRDLRSFDFSWFTSLYIGSFDAILCQFQILSAYLKFMTETGVLLGGERNETERQMENIIQLEQSIAEVSLLHWYR